MKQNDFSEIASRYEREARVQKSAGEILMNLIGLCGKEDLLDLGCGTGSLTRALREKTTGRVVGIDASEGMIRESRRVSEGRDIVFKEKRAEALDDREAFDLIFCNSSFQWFNPPEPVLRNCYRALRKGGRIGIQAPARRTYSPNFITAIEAVKTDSRTRETFTHFRDPWFFLESEEAYRSLLESVGFYPLFSRLEVVQTRHPLEEILQIFESGAVAGYLNPVCYGAPIDPRYPENFRRIVREAFRDQAEADGWVTLTFHRIYLLAAKQ